MPRGTTTASVSKAKASFSEFLNRAAYGEVRIVVTSHGSPKAAVIGLEDLERLERLELIEAAMEADAEYEAGEALEFEKVMDEL